MKINYATDQDSTCEKYHRDALPKMKLSAVMMCPSTQLLYVDENTHNTRSRMTLNNETTKIRCTITLRWRASSAKNIMSYLIAMPHIYLWILRHLLRAQPVFWLLSAPLSPLYVSLSSFCVHYSTQTHAYFMIKWLLSAFRHQHCYNGTKQLRLYERPWISQCRKFIQSTFNTWAIIATELYHNILFSFPLPLCYLVQWCARPDHSWDPPWYK